MRARKAIIKTLSVKKLLRTFVDVKCSFVLRPRLREGRPNYQRRADPQIWMYLLLFVFFFIIFIRQQSASVTTDQFGLKRAFSCENILFIYH